MKIRILSIVQGLWGGVGKYAHLIACIHERFGFQLRTIVINARQWPCHRQLFDDRINREIVIKSRLDFSWVHDCAQEVENFKPDLLFVHGFNGPFMAMFIRWKLSKKIPFVCSYHGDYNAPTPIKKLVAPVINYVLYRIYALYAERIVTVSNFSRDILIKRRVPADKIEVIYNGLKADFQPLKTKKAVRAEWKVPDDAFVVGWLGRFSPEKGAQGLIEAFHGINSLYDNCYLVLAGEGPQLEEMQSLVATLGISKNILFLGLVEDVDSFLNGIDVFVLPSLRENHSIALLEAMRASKAIVATEVGGNGESIRHELEGLLVPVSDCAALSQALLRFIDERSLRNVMGAAARKRFEQKFLLEDMLEKTLGWLTTMGTNCPRFFRNRC